MVVGLPCVLEVVGGASWWHWSQTRMTCRRGLRARSVLGWGGVGRGDLDLRDAGVGAVVALDDPGWAVAAAMARVVGAPMGVGVSTRVRRRRWATQTSTSARGALSVDAQGQQGDVVLAVGGELVEQLVAQSLQG